MKSSAGIQGQGNHFKCKKSKCSRGIKDSALTSAGHANKDIFRTVRHTVYISVISHDFHNHMSEWRE